MENNRAESDRSRPVEIVGIFNSYETLQGAIDDLLLAGFARCELSLSGQQQGERAIEPVLKLADDPQARRVDHFCSEALGDAEGSLIGGFALIPAFAGTWVAGAAGAGVAATAGLTAATGGTGALVGLALAYMLSKKWHAEHRRQVEEGGMLLWVGLREPSQKDVATDILKSHGAHDVHSHDLVE